MSEREVGYNTGLMQGYAARNPTAMKDRHTAHNMIALLSENARMLIEEAQGLRERISPLLTGEERAVDEKYGIPPAASKISAELGEILVFVQQARGIIRIVQEQLDL